MNKFFLGHPVQICFTNTTYVVIMTHRFSQTPKTNVSPILWDWYVGAPGPQFKTRDIFFTTGLAMRSKEQSAMVLKS